MPLNPDEFTKLVSTIDILNTEAAGLRTALMTTDKRARRGATVGTIGVVVGIIGGTVGLFGVIVGANARATAEDLAESRREARVASCTQSNQATMQVRNALIAGVGVLTQPDPRRGETQQASLDRFVVEYSRNIEAALPFRDCRPEGIEAFFSNPPVDPALGKLTTTTTTGG